MGLGSYCGVNKLEWGSSLAICWESNLNGPLSAVEMKLTTTSNEAVYLMKCIDSPSFIQMETGIIYFNNVINKKSKREQ